MDLRKVSTQIALIDLCLFSAGKRGQLKSKRRTFARSKGRGRKRPRRPHPDYHHHGDGDEYKNFFDVDHPPEAYGFPQEHEYDEPHKDEYDHHGHGGGDGFGSPHLKFEAHVCTNQFRSWSLPPFSSFFFLTGPAAR